MHIYISAIEMASPVNQHCANCIDTLSFPIGPTIWNSLPGSHSVISVKAVVCQRLKAFLFSIWFPLLTLFYRQLFIHSSMLLDQEMIFITWTL